MKRHIMDRRSLSIMAAGVMLLSILACVSDPDDEWEENGGYIDESANSGGGGGGGDQNGGGGGGGAQNGGDQNGGGVISDCSSPEEFNDELHIDDEVTLEGCYVVNADIKVMAGGHLRIKPGSTFYFRFNSGLYVEEGALTAVGTRTSPISFLGKEEQKVSGREDKPGYPWHGIVFKDSEDTSNRIEHATLEGGGYYTLGASLRIGNSVVSIKDTTMSHSTGRGLFIDDDSELLEFFNVEIIGGADSYVMAGWKAWEKFEGNIVLSGAEGEERLELLAYTDPAEFTEPGAYRLPDFGVPYLAGLGITLRGPDVRLEIDPGVVLRIGDGESEFSVEDGAVLIANGSVDKPIIIEPEKQMWNMLRYFQTDSPDNLLRNVIVRDAVGGAATGAINVGGLREYDDVDGYIPSRVQVENLSVEYSEEVLEHREWVRKLFVGKEGRIESCSGLDMGPDDIRGPGKEATIENCGLD